MSFLRKRKQFHAFQIELTTRCPLRCVMCVKSAYTERQLKDMNFNDFEKRILPYLSLTENVVLEGWGESLFHEDLINFVRAVKKANAKAGFVTCGMGLTKDKIRTLLKEGIDFLGFSLSGAKKETHESIRVGSNFEEIIEAIRNLVEEKRRMNLERPEVHIDYLMLRENIEELPEIVELSYSLSVKKLILLNIIQITNFSQEGGKVFEYEGRNPYEYILKRAEDLARKRGIQLIRPSLVAHEIPVCDEDPLRNLYISVEGEVSPCVFLYPPVPSPIKRIFKKEEYYVEKLSFGNVFLEDLTGIWEKEAYRDFRNRFLLRKKAGEEMVDAFLNFKSYNIKSFPPPPEYCLTCHKIFNL